MSPAWASSRLERVREHDDRPHPFSAADHRFHPLGAQPFRQGRPTRSRRGVRVEGVDSLAFLRVELDTHGSQGTIAGRVDLDETALTIEKDQAALRALRETPKARLQQVMLQSDLTGCQVLQHAA